MAAKLKIPSLAEIEADEEDSSTKKQPLFKTHRHVKWDEEDKKELSKSIVSKVKNTSQLTSTSTAATSALGTMGHIQTESPQSSGTILSGPVRTNENVVAGTSSLSQKPMSRGNMQSSKISQVMTNTKPTMLAGATTTCTTVPVAPVCDKEAAVPLKPGKPNSIVVSPKQRGNPVLKHIRNVPWEFGDIVPDYVLGQTTCALFLSLRYHHLNPNYIHERLKLLGYSYDLRILLVQVDVKDPHNSLKELAKICILADCTLILAWSPEEAGRYLETYKSFESKPPDLIMEKTDSNLLGRVSDCLSTVKKVNKPDTTTLLSEFGSMDEIIKADQEKLALCPGFGPQKAVRLFEVFHTPFLKSKKVRQVESPQRAKRKTEKEEAEPSSTS